MLLLWVISAALPATFGDNLRGLTAPPALSVTPLPQAATTTITVITPNISFSSSFTYLHYPNFQGVYYVLTEGAQIGYDNPTYVWEGVGTDLVSKVLMIQGKVQIEEVGEAVELAASCDTQLYVFVEFYNQAVDRTGGFDTSLSGQGFQEVTDSNRQIRCWKPGSGCINVRTWVKDVNGGVRVTLPATTKPFIGGIGIGECVANTTTVTTTVTTTTTTSTSSSSRFYFQSVGTAVIIIHTFISLL